MLIRHLAKGALCVALLLTASCEFSWDGRGIISEEQQELGVRDVDALERDYDTQRYWASVRERMDGRATAISDGMENIVRTFDRHFLNYDWDAPYLGR